MICPRYFSQTLWSAGFAPQALVTYLLSSAWLPISIKKGGFFFGRRKVQGEGPIAFSSKIQTALPLKGFLLSLGRTLMFIFCSQYFSELLSTFPLFFPRNKKTNFWTAGQVPFPGRLLGVLASVVWHLQHGSVKNVGWVNTLGTDWIQLGSTWN